MPREQSTVWLAVAVLICQAVNRCHSDSSCSGMCPSIDATRCACAVKPVIAGSSESGSYVLCSGLGNLAMMPSFGCSPTITEFSIVASSLARLQSAAFAGVKAESLWLTALGISDVDVDAFIGLETVLQTISLGSNNITFLAGNTFNRLGSLTSVVLEHNRLTELQPGLFRNLTQMVNINLQWNNIKTVSGGSFDGLDSLQSLDMSYNAISDLPANFLTGASTVRLLLLAGNRLTNLTSPAFNSMPNLTSLDLSSNLLSTLPQNMLPSCRKLINLYLSSNNISSISSLAIVALARLQVIDARSNIIGSIPFDAFRNASALKEVLFANNSIRQIDSGLFATTSTLQNLNLSQNYIQSIPVDAFPSQGSTLKYLDVSHNSLTEADFTTRLPFLNTADFSYNQLNTLNFTSAPYLTSLRASYNQLRRFGKLQLAQLPALKELYLDHNMIDHIEPGWLSANAAILNLSLSHNALTELSLLGGVNLIGLRLNDNNIRNISDAAFSSSSSLSEIYLQNNRIEYLTGYTFASLGRLKILDLSNNSIRYLPPFAFRDLAQLEILLLFHNGFSVITNNTFSGLSSLKIFHLAGNNLQTLAHEDVSAQLTTNRTALYLGLNPFLCSCDLLWIRESSALKDADTSVCYANQMCYLLMCNPVQNCPLTVNPIYRDSDPFCVQPVPRFCIPTTSTSTTTVSTTSTTSTTTTPPPTDANSDIPTSPREGTNNSFIIHSVADMTLSTTGWRTTLASVEQAKGIQPYVYIIIGVVLGAAVLAATTIALFCLIQRRRYQKEKDPLKQVGGYREGSNDEIGILKNFVGAEQSSELEDPKPTVWTSADGPEDGSEEQTTPEGYLASGFRPRPKGTVGLPYGNFRLPNSDSRRWKTGGLPDNFDSSSPGFGEESKAFEGDESQDDPERKKQRNASEFVDGDTNSSQDGDFRFPSELGGGMLWRGGQRGPYDTEKLPKNDAERAEQQRSKATGRISEFADDDENLPSPGLDDFRLPGKLGGDLLWRGGDKGKYVSAKFPNGYTKEDEEEAEASRAGTAKTRRGSETEFVDEDDNLSPSTSGDFRFPVNYGEGLLWRGAKKDPYEAQKLPKDFNSETAQEDEPAERKKQKRPKSISSPRRSEFTGDEEDLPSPSSDGFRLPSRAGSDLMWRGTAQKGPYVSSKLPKGYGDDEISFNPAGKRGRKAGKRRMSNASEFLDTTCDPYATANFRLPISRSGDDIHWRVGQKRPYSTVKLPKDYCSSDITDYDAASKSQRRRKSSETEFVDSDQNSSLYSSSFNGFRIPGKTGTVGPHTLKWRSSKFVEGSTSPKAVVSDGISVNSKRKNGHRESSVFESDTGNDASEQIGSSFGVFKTVGNTRPTSFHWKLDRFANALTLTSGTSPVDGTLSRRNSGSDLDASPSDRRKPESPTDQVRIPYGTAKDASAQRLNYIKARASNEAITRKPTITTASVA